MPRELVDEAIQRYRGVARDGMPPDELQPLIVLRSLHMRTLVLLLLLVPYARPVHADEDKIIKALKQRPLRIIRDEKKRGEPIIGLWFPASRIPTDADWKLLRGLKHLRWVELGGPKVNDATLKGV